MINKCLLFCLVFISFGQINCVLDPKVVCYYEYWFAWRTNDGKMTVDDIDSSLCTDIVYAYLGISTTSEISIPDQYLMVDKHDFDTFSKNKGKARALAAIGGWSLSGNFPTVVSSSTGRATFVNSVVSFLRKFNFDGITLDWARTAWSTDEFNNFVKLLESLHAEFVNAKYTLGITIAAVPTNFDIKQVNQYVDFISVQTYDYHGSWELEVGFEAPIDWQVQTLRALFNSGATMNKLLGTIPMFAHTWLLSDPSKTDIGAKATGPGRQGPNSQADGKLNFNELCTQIRDDPTGWTVHRDTAKASIYAVHGNTWVSFEDTKTCEEKSKNFTTEGFGGVVVQALSNEDYKGICGTKYPLLKAINAGLNKEPVQARTPAPVQSTVSPVPVTPDPTKVCKKTGTFRDLSDCSVYHVCEEFLGTFTDEVKHCAKTEAYDETSAKCVDKSLVAGCH